MVRMKLGVNQKHASPYASAADASGRRQSNPGSPIAASSNSRHDIESASADTQFVSGMIARMIAAAKMRAYPGFEPARHTAQSASGNHASPKLCGPSPYFAS